MRQLGNIGELTGPRYRDVRLVERTEELQIAELQSAFRDVLHAYASSDGFLDPLSRQARACQVRGHTARGTCRLDGYVEPYIPKMGGRARNQLKSMSDFVVYRGNYEY